MQYTQLAQPLPLKHSHHLIAETDRSLIPSESASSERIHDEQGIGARHLCEFFAAVQAII